MKHHEAVSREEAILETASLVARVMRHWFRELRGTPPSEWGVRLDLTPLGSLAIYCPGVPPAIRSEMFRVISVLAWLYPGVGESKALRENAALRAALVTAQGGNFALFSVFTSAAKLCDAWDSVTSTADAKRELQASVEAYRERIAPLGEHGGTDPLKPPVQP